MKKKVLLHSPALKVIKFNIQLDIIATSGTESCKSQPIVPDNSQGNGIQLSKQSIFDDKL